MAQRSVLAYFDSETKSAEAAAELKNQGYETVQIDRISLFPDNNTDDVTNPLTGDFASLANLTMDTGGIGNDEGILLAAHPDASGLADAEIPRATPFLVTVVCEPREVDGAVQTLKQYGARV